MTSEISPAVTAEAAEAVRTVMYRYARAVDRRDEVLLAACLTDDVVLHRVDGPRNGRDAVLAFYRTVFEGPTVWSKHLITNVAVTAVPTGFEASAYFHAVSHTATDGMSVLGEYTDLLVPDAAGALRIRRKSIDVQRCFRLEVQDG